MLCNSITWFWLHFDPLTNLLRIYLMLFFKMKVWVNSRIITLRIGVDLWIHFVTFVLKRVKWIKRTILVDNTLDVRYSHIDLSTTFARLVFKWFISSQYYTGDILIFTLNSVWLLAALTIQEIHEIESSYLWIFLH